LQIERKSRKYNFFLGLEINKRYQSKREGSIDRSAPLKIGRHIFLPQMECVIVHAQISFLINIYDGYLTDEWVCSLLKKCRFVRFECKHYGMTECIVMNVPEVEERGALYFLVGVYMGSFVARRIQRAWRRYMVRRRRMALCMASNPRLGAGASPLLGAVIRVLCVEDLVRIV
jgi:hypothetical protein